MLQEHLNASLERFQRIRQLAARVQSDFNLPPLATFADIQTAAAIADVIARSPGVPLGVLQSEAWNSPPPRAVELVQQGRKLAELSAFTRQRFKREVLEQEHQADIAFIEAKQSSFLKFLNFLDGRFRAIQKRWREYRGSGYTASLLQQAHDLRKVDSVRQTKAVLAAQHTEAQQLFGALWQGEASDWNALESYIRWVIEFRRVCVDKNLQEQALIAASRPTPDVSTVIQLSQEAAQFQQQLAEVRTRVGWPSDYLADSPLGHVAERLEGLLGCVDI